MAKPLTPSSVGAEDKFSGNFTLAKYVRGQTSAEIERRIGYGAGRLDKGYWLLFAVELPSIDNFEFGGYTHFSGAKIGDPRMNADRPTVEQSLAIDVGGQAGVQSLKAKHIAGLKLFGADRLAKVLPVAGGSEYPIGSGIYQCNVPNPILCKIAAFVPPGEVYLGDYV